MTRSDRPNEVTRAFLAACYDYFLIITPVALYVALEAIRAEELARFFLSPEWSIATIFVSFQGRVIYRTELERTGRPLSGLWLNFVDLASLVVIIAASINTYMALTRDSRDVVFLRISLFILTSASFLIFVGGAKLALSRKVK